jgi:hypothetical protein
MEEWELSVIENDDEKERKNKKMLKKKGERRNWGGEW